jgi:hypothetical protein
MHYSYTILPDRLHYVWSVNDRKLFHFVLWYGDKPLYGFYKLNMDIGHL